jgi:hypothetical protein
MIGRTTRRTRRLAGTLSAAALASATLATSGSALASPASRAGDRPAVPAAHSAVAAYAWWDGLSLDSYYDYNSTGGTISVTTGSTGQYTVDFGGMGSISTHAIVQVSSYEGATVCAVSGWSADGSALQAFVDCYDQVTGAAHVGKFNLMVTHVSAAPHGTFDFSYVWRDASSGKLTGNYQYNSAHKANSVKHLGIGRYAVTFPGPRSSGTSGSVKVTPFGAGAGDCELAGWHGSAIGEVISVNCFTVAHAPQNREFMVTYAATNNLMGQNGFTDASAYATKTAALYQPAIQYGSAHGARVSVVHYSTGSYEVLPVGSGGDFADWGGDVQVNAVGTNGAHCVSNGWASELTPSVDVSCYGRHGSLANSPFTVEWVVP